MPTSRYATPPIAFETEKQWTNWGGNQSCSPAFTVRPRNEREVLDVVRFAIREGLPVRAVGAGHSFTPIVQTGGVLIDTASLTGVTGVDTATHRVRMLGGTRLTDLGDVLWDKGLSLSNQGDIDKQAIAGAISTGTHGSGIRLGSFSSTVRWVKLVTGHGEIVEIGEDNLRELRAAQVALGTLGVIVEVELQAMPRYHLAEQITYPGWQETVSGWQENIDNHRHYSFIWCPRDESAGLYELPTPAGESMVDRCYTKRYQTITLSEPDGIVTTEGARRDRAYRIYAGGFMIPFHEMEYYVPAEKGQEAVTAVRDLLLTRHTDQRYPLEVRWVKGDEGLISPFYGRDTTVLSVSGAPGTDYWPYLRDMDALLEDFDARPHWGKIHFLTRDRVRRIYPEYDAFNSVRRRYDPNGVFLNDSLRQLFG
ncbi:FAD/FMN-containing dehydrogenase [Streptomyces sp. 2333.5]|uniref:D-arabinono-1,4-lactone oxidase n=1 Tax=Streptomyces TaxID=1883 RepID=UPI000894EFC0|nr:MULTISPECIES: D-arabinono-1,4-lactone oxidase [unclassified Streptomyces]PJJ05587.1 FAD/FMN-containing dehydrogenase [Streptomyces sp. 2333.5]SEE79719.1 FAD/FMN-containing dehydrogenase [Streptomyces sp. 2314.4]SEF01276.1 FAD/FMN-containing dehydrogenase [Streptomyces sp. 2112.2]